MCCVAFWCGVVCVCVEMVVRMCVHVVCGVGGACVHVVLCVCVYMWCVVLVLCVYMWCCVLCVHVVCGVGGACGSDCVLHEGVCPATRTHAPNWVAEHLGASSRPPLLRPDGGGNPWPCTCVHGPKKHPVKPRRRTATADKSAVSCTSGPHALSEQQRA